MDKYDLRAHGVENNIHSLGKKCTCGKVKNLSDCRGSEKPGHESDNEISSSEGTKTESRCEHLSSSECTKDNARDCGSLSSVISSLTQNKQVYGDENMKGGEVLKQSSINSDASELVTGTDTHSPSVGRQLITESWSSDSSRIASSNDSYQDQVDGKFSRSSDLVTSTSADQKCSPIVKSSDKVTGVNVEKTDHLLMSNLCKMKITELPDQCNANSCYEVEDDDALEVACRVAKEVEQNVYKEASESSSSVEEKNSKTVDQSCVDSVYTRKDKLCEVQVTYKDVEDRKMLMEDKQLCVEVDESAMVHMGAKVTRESSNLTTKPEDISRNGQTTDVSGIDLNEDFLGNGTDYVSKPISVAATPGISVCSHLCHTQGKPGGTGWRGSAATSAFRKTSFFKKCKVTDSSQPSHVKGLDLNIAAAGAGFECIETPSSLNFGESSTSIDACSTRFDFDLNCASENNGIGYLSSKPYARDFDLNDNPAASRDPCNDAQPLRNKALDEPALLFLGNPRQLDPNRAYLPDLGSLHSYSYGHGQAKHYPVMLPPAEQMQRMVPLHHNTPPHAFHYDHGLLFHPSNHHLPSPPMQPYMIDPSCIAAFPGASHLMEIPDIRPNFDLNVNSSENTGRGVISRYHQYMPPLMEEHVRPFQHSATTFKRREPEGGWDSHQLGSHRQWR